MKVRKANGRTPGAAKIGAPRHRQDQAFISREAWHLGRAKNGSETGGLNRWGGQQGG